MRFEGTFDGRPYVAEATIGEGIDGDFVQYAVWVVDAPAQQVYSYRYSEDGPVWPSEAELIDWAREQLERLREPPGWVRGAFDGAAVGSPDVPF